MWLTSPTPVSVMTGALWFTRCSGLSQAPLRAASPCGWPALCWLPVAARQELALHSRVGSETPTALPFAQTAWDSLVLVSVSQHTLKRCNKASASVTAIHEKALKSESVSCLVLSTSLWPTDCTTPCSSVHGISQARIREWVAVSFSRGSSQPRDWTQVSCIGRWWLYHWASREAPWEVPHL